MKQESNLNSLIGRLRLNKDRLENLREVPLVNAQPNKKCAGVYIISFEGKLQYIGSSGNLFARVRNNLINGNRESHTLVNKLCVLRGLETKDAINWLRQNSRIKFMATDSEDDARLLEDIMIALNHPYFNKPLRKLRKEPKEEGFKETIITMRKLDEWARKDVRTPRRGKKYDTEN